MARIRGFEMRPGMPSVPFTQPMQRTYELFTDIVGSQNAGNSGRMGMSLAANEASPLGANMMTFGVNSFSGGTHGQYSPYLNCYDNGRAASVSNPEGIYTATLITGFELEELLGGPGTTSQWTELGLYWQLIRLNWIEVDFKYRTVVTESYSLGGDVSVPAAITVTGQSNHVGVSDALPTLYMWDPRTTDLGDATSNPSTQWPNPAQWSYDKMMSQFGVKCCGRFKDFTLRWRPYYYKPVPLLTDGTDTSYTWHRSTAAVSLDTAGGQTTYLGPLLFWLKNNYSPPNSPQHWHMSVRVNYTVSMPKINSTGTYFAGVAP